MVDLEISNKSLAAFAQTLEGEFYYTDLMKVIYATDASVYRELPLAVALPKNDEDLKKLIEFANTHKTSLIPRAAGTSLAGQLVGKGIVVDISKHFTKIIEFNEKEKWVRVQPGVVRDELNAFLKPFGLFFSPITSTANRAMIGGMVGNNSSGTTSIVYGTTREHVLELKTLLSDGSEAVFNSLSKSEFKAKTKLPTLEGEIYRQIQLELDLPKNQKNIRKHFPKKSIHRRNTGYALDFLLETEMFSKEEKAFDFCKLLCGSEGTLAFTTEIKLHLDEVQKPVDVIAALHFSNVDESLRATQLAMKHNPTQCELIDKIILDCTKENINQRKNRWFIEGDPAALLMVEFREDTLAEAMFKAETMITDLKNHQMGYAFPVISPENTDKLRELRKAGLGLLANIPGDKKAVACIEDTAVALEDLADYIQDVGGIMDDFGQKQVVYAHAGAGELHLRPILNLKETHDVNQFYEISKASAELVKKYDGSLSGEHGDGRLRGAFIPIMVGEENYELFKRVKSTWDPNYIFNPNKIVDTPPMNTSLRYEPDVKEKKIDTVFDFSDKGGILRAAEKCNGSGDCRKLPLSGGTMCPSYQATRNEKDTTRARANTLREFLTKSEKANPFDHEEIKTVMDLCLSCKGCTSECPSNVDMSTLKAEFLHQYYKENGVPFRAKAFAYINEFNKLGGAVPSLYNFFLTNPLFSKPAKKMLGVAEKRSLPTIHKVSLRKWYKKNYKASNGDNGTVVLFCDEFTNWNDTEIGIKSIELLQALKYHVKLVEHPESGRAAISKGLLPRAKKMANKNVSIFKDLINSDTPLLGIEPSAILSFRDEYPRLVDKELVAEAKKISRNVLMIDEFLAREVKKGKITSADFTTKKEEILLHGHCHQKSLGNIHECVRLLSVPENYSVKLIPSGCCGMAGSFGYEKEHYELSQKVGGMVLFPAVKSAVSETKIVAAGTSCRHQIKDATERKAIHPVEVLWEALISYKK
ncbi:FAD-binding and (Fe-S)-binding domain-containing protein [Brumimicrobium aurantiacum]|uniref:FAD-binding oxidoreductase n=1 Tax=Brumimicrobium aurantiacum TaxID=1737063 RepID=A0A3E1EYU4_9FLAO|nr:FAD-binding and (Fe-S)-binding domain-containing protein [Brumimicrobium aurantiacum]RFC54741.1 FAD-binding oxidoreductase [Brumimicrobium aurantiacum]